MKTQIAKKLPLHNLTTHSNLNLYIADYPKTINNKGVVLFADEPNDIKCVHILNPKEILICFDGFKDNALPIDIGNCSEQCECVLFPDRCDETDWILFIENKYANDRTAAFRENRGYPNKMTDQIIETVKYFREKGIIAPNRRVWAIVSFPNLVEEFNSTIFKGDLSELDILFKYKIVIRGTNAAKIISEKRIKLNSD